MSTLIVRKKIVPVFKAEQWFKGVEISFCKVIDKGPFVPSGNWSDRFEDHPDIYVKSRDHNIEVKEGDWIMVDSNGSISVVSDTDFKTNYTTDLI